MKKTAFLLVILLLHLGLNTAYGHEKDTLLGKKIQEIDANMFNDPVAAKTALLLLLNANKSAPDSITATIYLKLATALGMTNKLDSAIFYAQKSTRLFPNTNLEKAGALKLIAILHRITGDYKNAEIAIQESLALNDSLWHDPHLKAAILQEYGSLCLDQHANFKATTLFLKALDIISAPAVLADGGKFTAIKIRVNLAEAYLASGNYPFAIREFSKSLPELATFKDEEGLLRGGVQLTEAYIRSDNYEAADSLVEYLMPIAKKLENDELRSYLLLKQGESWIARKQFVKSVPFLRNAFELLNANNSPVLLECVNSYLSALSKTGDLEEARRIQSMPNVQAAVASGQPAERLDYKKVAILFLRSQLSAQQVDAYYQDLLRLSDSVNAQNQRQSAAEILAKYQFERQKENEKLLIRENELLKQKTEFKRKQFFLFIAIALLVFAVLAMSIVRLRQRAILQANLLKSKEQEIVFQKDRTEWMEREKSFRDQLINQQKVVLTQAIADKEEMDLRLKELVKEKQEARRGELLEQLEKSKDKKLNIEILLTEFNAIHPSFVPQLMKKYPELSMADAQFCTLFRMNLTTKEISVLLNIEPRSIYKKKYRTMEKMGLGEGDDFEKVVFGIG